jgi:hypothetical protein
MRFNPNLSRYALAAFVALALAGTSMIGCNKKDETLINDYNTKKAAADKLMADATAGATSMKADHQKWMSVLDSAVKLPNADTAKIAGFRQQIATHETEITAALADADSIKLYDNVSTDDNAKLVAANDRLGANMDDLNNKWKALTDSHSKLQSDIMAMLASPNSASAEKPVEKPAEKKMAEPKKTPGIARRAAGVTTKD